MGAICELGTAARVIEELGGIPAVASMTGRKYSAAHNWSVVGSFPSNTYVLMQEALREKGFSAPKSLWRMVESPDTQPEGNQQFSDSAARGVASTPGEVEP